mmetsp:Transcript_16890/g.40120  ORF Transcript_16890/g.40120 Transcript_16890/m.40120 type:complete len:217 (+) Transcript_16890:114-764(+)
MPSPSPSPSTTRGTTRGSVLGVTYDVPHTPMSTLPLRLTPANNPMAPDLRRRDGAGTAKSNSPSTELRLRKCGPEGGDGSVEMGTEPSRWAMGRRGCDAGRREEKAEGSERLGDEDQLAVPDRRPPLPEDPVDMRRELGGESPLCTSPPSRERGPESCRMFEACSKDGHGGDPRGGAGAGAGTRAPLGGRLSSGGGEMRPASRRPASGSRVATAGR